MSRSHTIIFPDLGDAHAIKLVDFLNQLTADAESHYLAQILRYRQKHRPTPPHPERPWHPPAEDS